MSRKKQPPVDWVAHRRWENRNQAKLIKEEWPFVSLVTIELDFPYGEFKSQQWHYAGDGKAFFDYPCPCECRQGGIALTGPITSMVKERETERSLELVCRGMEEDGRLYCGLTSQCRITISYKK